MLSPQHQAILRDVSRSFYLSLRFLPGPVRGPLSLGYLLARASDTLADCTDQPAAERLRLLTDFRTAADGQTPPGFLERASQFAATVPHAGERVLLQRLSECLALLHASPPEEAALIRKVLGHILRGQQLDIERFTAPAALPDAAALEDYTFLVAGCVGEFWTEVCALRLPGFSRLPVEEMIQLGIRYGRGLQLINVLRDQPRDMAAGRCYLPENELRAAGLPGLTWPSENWPAWHSVRSRWIDTAREHLAAGRVYVRSLRGRRLRFATLLPLLIGGATLDLLAAQPAIEAPQPAKVTRSQVKRLLLRALRLSLTGRI